MDPRTPTDSAQNTLRLCQASEGIANRLRQGEVIHAKSKIFTRQAALGACLEDSTFLQTLLLFLSGNDLMRLQASQNLQRIFNQRVEAQSLAAAMSHFGQEVPA